MADTLLMVDPKVPGSGFRIPRGQLSQAQSDGMMLGEEWQNKDGERYYYPLAGRGDAVKAGLSRPAGSKAHSEEELSETIPPLDTSTDPPPDIGMMDRVRQGVQGALGDPGIQNLPAAVGGAFPTQAAGALAQGGSAVARVGSAMMGRAGKVGKAISNSTDGMLEELKKMDKGSIIKRILQNVGGGEIYHKARSYMDRTE